MKKNLARLMSLALSFILTLAALPVVQASAIAYSSIPAGTYTIASKANEAFLLDVYGNQTANKANVQVYQKASNATQQFNITKTSGGWYSITPRSNSSYAVNPYSDAPKNGTNVNVYTVNQKDKTQGFYFEEMNGFYVIRSAYNPVFALTVEGSPKNMANVRLETFTGKATQFWRVYKVATTASTSKGYTDTDVQKAIKAIGVQKDNKKWTNMCASLTVSYARFLQTSTAFTPEQSSDSRGYALWSKCQGTVINAGSQANVLKQVKAQLDKGGLALINVHSSAGQHWVMAYRYDGAGTSLSSFWVADPWQGNLRPLDKCGYSLYFVNGVCRVVLVP